MKKSNIYFTDRQIAIIKWKLPPEDVTEGDLKSIERKCNILDLPDVILRVLEKYPHKDTPYTPRQISLLHGRSVVYDKAEAIELIHKVEAVEGIDVASQLYERFEPYLYGVHPDKKDFVSIKEALAIMDAISPKPTKWHYEKLYPDGDETKLYGKPRKQYYVEFRPPRLGDDLDVSFPFNPEDEFEPDPEPEYDNVLVEYGFEEEPDDIDKLK